MNNADIAVEIDDWSLACDSYEQASDSLGGLKPDLWKVERAMKDIEYNLIANGGDGIRFLDGKNAEAREAQLAAMLPTFPGYAALVTERDRIKRDIVEAELDRESLLEHIRRHRAVVAYTESENLLAAALAGSAKTQER